MFVFYHIIYIFSPEQILSPVLPNGEPNLLPGEIGTVKMVTVTLSGAAIVSVHFCIYLIRRCYWICWCILKDSDYEIVLAMERSSA